MKNDYGESNANLNLNIESEAELDGTGPTFVEKPRITSERNGKLVIMEFKVKADPRPAIAWSREGKVIKETSKLKMFMTQSADVYHIRLELTVSKTHSRRHKNRPVTRVATIFLSKSLVICNNSPLAKFNYATRTLDQMMLVSSSATSKIPLENSTRI